MVCRSSDLVHGAHLWTISVSLSMTPIITLYRGQSQVRGWKLEATLDRGETRGRAVEDHLAQFALNAVDRLPVPSGTGYSINQSWALGQHVGLLTPLLDWTMSPYVAAFFAFAEPDHHDTRRAVWAVRMDLIRSKLEQEKRIDASDAVRFLRPLTGNNTRMIAQAGAFSRQPKGVSVDDWVRSEFRGTDVEVLVGIVIPDRDRKQALTQLHAMNINYLSLFPDLQGAALHTNLCLELPTCAWPSFPIEAPSRTDEGVLGDGN